MIRSFCDIIRRLAQRELPSHDQLTRNELMAEAYQPAEGFVDEVWRPVPGWEGVYMVSDQGRVKSLDRLCVRRGGQGALPKKGIVLRQKVTDKRQHLRVQLQREGKVTAVYVYELVLSTFSSSRPLGYEVRHLDGDTTNNSISNLGWVKTPSKLELAQSRKDRLAKEFEPSTRKTPGYVPSKEELDATFTYRNGDLLWRDDRNSRTKAGMRAGSPDKDGYIIVRLNGRGYRAHRLIWAMHGNPPAETIDHINRDPSDNRIENLRAASNSEQHCNIGLPANNRSGVKGVFWRKDTNDWLGRVCFRGKAYHAGIFNTKEDCAKAVEALREHLHGAFAHHAIAT